MAPPSTPADRDKAPDEVYCRDCGSVISERAEICPECGVRQRPSSGASDLLEGGNPVLAALLSALLPGLGQIYNRELERGLAFIVGSLVAAFLVAFAIGLLIYPVIWVYAIYDAYTRAEPAYRDRVGPARDEGVGRATGRGTTSEYGRHDSDEEWGSQTDREGTRESDDSDRR